MKFLLDVHLGPSLAHLLEEEGHTCRLVIAIADPRSSDLSIFDMAVEQDEVILTYDLDFGKLLAFSQKNKPSVIIFRIEKINNQRFFELIKDNWEVIEMPLQKGALVIMEPDAVRIRELPI